MPTETFTLQVEVTITDKNEIIVGNHPYGLFDRYKLFIEKDGDEYRVTDEIKHISDCFDSRDECIKWVLKKLSKELKDA